MADKINKRKSFKYFLIIFTLFSITNIFAAPEDRDLKRKKELDELQQRFIWWPTDANPAPIKDKEREGYWWWPKEAGKIVPWGNRGYIYVYKIIFDYKEELPPAQPEEARPSLLIKKIIRNVKIYFDYNKASLRPDHIPILENAVRIIKNNPQADILITGNCDQRGSEAYNEKLGKRRGEAVKSFMLENAISEERIRIVSRGKLDAVAPVNDLIGMQKDRNAQFIIAEVEEIMIPYQERPEESEGKHQDKGKFFVEREEKVESEIKVSLREYVVKKNDTLSKIAKEQLGGGHRWQHLYELNKDKIKDPNKLIIGQKIVIPVE